MVYFVSINICYAHASQTSKTILSDHMRVLRGVNTLTITSAQSSLGSSDGSTLKLPGVLWHKFAASFVIPGGQLNTRIAFHKMNIGSLKSPASTNHPH